MPFFRTALQGTFQGQEIVNILWYRTVTPIPTLLDFLNYAAAIAAEVKESVWDVAIGNDLRLTMPPSYTLQSIKVDGVDDDGLALSTTSYELAVNEVGEGATDTDGGAHVVIFKANLEPAFGPGVGLPRRGYLAIGPVASNSISNSGDLVPAAVTTYQDVADRFAQDIITVSPPGVFFPVRVRKNDPPVPFAFGYRDIQSFVVRVPTSFRRSRMPKVEA